MRRQLPSACLFDCVCGCLPSVLSLKMQAHAFLAENALNPELEFAGKKKVNKTDQTHTHTHRHSLKIAKFVCVCVFVAMGLGNIFV